MKELQINLNKRIQSFLIITTILTLAAGLTTITPVNARANGPEAISDDASCGVCGMFPARYPQWQTQIVFTDNKMVPFDGAKDMFKYLLMMGNYDKAHSRKDVSAIWVKDFNSGSWFNGEKAIFVVGSKQMGPMGKELIPFEAKLDAEKFQAEHGGEIHGFDEISMDIVSTLGMGGMKMKGMNMNGGMDMKGDMDTKSEMNMEGDTNMKGQM